MLNLLHAARISLPRGLALIAVLMLCAARSGAQESAGAGAGTALSNPTPAAAAPAPVSTGAPPASIAAPAAPAAPSAVVMPAVALPQTVLPDNRFPRYEALKPAVSFWTRVFGEYSELQSVVHSTLYPNRVFKVLDYRQDALWQDRFQLDKRRRGEEQDAKEEFDRLLKQVDEQRYAPQNLSGEARRLYDLYADLPGEDKYRKLIGTARVQRGLKERTDKALEVSDRYLPSMEKTFRGYELPVTLTRLPLVESSFNLDAYSKAGAAGIWQFIPSSARIYMRLNEVVDDRRDPWASTDGAARHLKDDYTLLQDWPLAITAYNYGRAGIARALDKVQGASLMDLINRFESDRFGFASRNYYAEFLAAVDVERAYRARAALSAAAKPLEFEVVETQHYVPYDTLRRLCGASDEAFQRLNPAYRPEVIEGKLYVPPGHLIRVPYGSARAFEVGYAKLGEHERFDSQRVMYLLHKVASGETLGRIAHDYHVPQKAIIAANELKSVHALRVGQVIRIPPREEARPGPITVALGEATPSQTLEQKLKQAREEQREDAASRQYEQKQKQKQKDKARLSVARTHKVAAGQTLSGIAKRYKVSVTALREANNLPESATLRVGQKLKVPG
ncbi:lytic transglycosylase domain-containing protein [Solimonas aquatica]|nr:lytic transglycosylase domain-containing protein [Solimonas aquatica]